MKKETLLERINNAETKIAKKTKTIENKTKLIVKKTEKLLKAKDEDERYWLEADIEDLESDIERLEKEVKETKEKLESYKLQLTEILQNEEPEENFPSILKEMQENLEEAFNESDRRKKEYLRGRYEELGYKEFVKAYKHSGYDFLFYTTDEKIRNNNKKQARDLVRNLYTRVKDKVGNIESWDYIRLEQGSYGRIVLNGFVNGDKGNVNVESILAGGYNIQRLHVRVLVKNA